jgi:arylsulfatase
MKNMIKTNIILIALLFPLIIFNRCTHDKAQQPPNIVLIMGDDIGFSDLGCYGGEIPTPNLDRLADEGMRFRQFYNMSKCETTRSSLMTGLYRGDERAISFVDLLKDAGYDTYQFGKEHFKDWVPDRCYAKNTCTESLTFWATTEYFLPPDSQFVRPFYRNGVETAAWELEYDRVPFYKTDVFTDYAIRYLRESIRAEKPFFLYLPYHAAHYPLQARPEDIDKFRTTYMVGWDKLRKARYERMIALGALDGKYPLSEPTSNVNGFRGHPKGDDEIRAKIPHYRPWDTLSEDEQVELDLEMAVFAAMVHTMDRNIGRVLDLLESAGQLDNTLIMYLSDNGSCPYDSNRDFDHPPGPADSYRTLGAAWANLGNTPFRFFKQFGHEGGSHTHFIVRWPDVIETPGAFTDHQAHLIDIFPTLLDVAGIDYPDWYGNLPTLPLDGRSIVPILTGQGRPDPDYLLSGFRDRFRMFRAGDWKIVRLNGEAWELYNLQEDMTETRNLAEERPDQLAAMIKAYELWLDQSDIKPAF